MVHLGNDWDDILADEFRKPYYLELREFLKREYAAGPVYPAMGDIFNALRYTAFCDVKVVLLGQDPYHGPGQAHGLCFSVQPGVAPPPSLCNIFRELQDDLGFPPPENGTLTPWARQGVLLLNTVLTVRQGQPNSHSGRGWETFTDRVISELDRKQTPVVFLLWGANARRKAEIIRNPLHHKLITTHPSPLSAYAGFLGCRHFSKANEILAQAGLPPVDWNLNGAAL